MKVIAIAIELIIATPNKPGADKPGQLVKKVDWI
jgi:hypothetical protein